MGPPNGERHRLQAIGGHSLKCAYFVFLVFLSLAGSARAQIAPFQGTLEYNAAAGTWPKLVVNAANGSAAYVLTLEPDKNADGTISHIDLVLRRPGGARDTNLLEPPYRWHGLQPYMFNACEFISDADCLGSVQTRSIQIKNRKLVVRISVAKSEINTIKDDPSDPSNYVFKDLAVDVQVDNLK